MWNSADALGIHNVFRYLFDTPTGAFTNPPLLSITFDASGNPDGDGMTSLPHGESPFRRRSRTGAYPRVRKIQKGFRHIWFAYLHDNMVY